MKMRCKDDDGSDEDVAGSSEAGAMVAKHAAEGSGESSRSCEARFASMRTGSVARKRRGESRAEGAKRTESDAPMRGIPKRRAPSAWQQRAVSGVRQRRPISAGQKRQQQH